MVPRLPGDHSRLGVTSANLYSLQLNTLRIMGRGTVISDGQGDEKIWLTEDVTYDGRVMASAGSTYTGFEFAAEFEVGNGAFVNCSWDPRGAEGNGCVRLDSSAGRALGEANNSGGKSTRVKITNAKHTGLEEGVWLDIATTDDAGDNNDNHAGSNIKCAPCSGGPGWLIPDA